MLKGAISIDIDTLNTHFKGFGLRQKEYDFADFRSGIENFLKFLAEFQIKATFFIVGKDLISQKNREVVLEIIKAGHEIANHSMNHIQGFRWLTQEQKIKEVSQAEQIITGLSKEKPVGFRAPGWNLNDETLQILATRHYLYDSSIFPSLLNPVLKLIHFQTMKSRPMTDRTTLGPLKYCLYPTQPWQTKKFNTRRLIELPISATPWLRVPFFATFLLKTGWPTFKISYQWIKLHQRPLVYEFHLFDFVDFAKPAFKRQVPVRAAKGVYLPQSIYTPFEQKWRLFRKAVSLMTRDYRFGTLKTLAQNFT